MPAKAVPCRDREVIHILPQEFIIDDQTRHQGAAGMNRPGWRPRCTSWTGAVASAQNIFKCANKAGLEVQDIVLQHCKAPRACLTPEEKELGCILVDIAGGTTDIAVLWRGSIYHTSVLAVGGDMLTNDDRHRAADAAPRGRVLKRKFAAPWPPW